MTPLLKMNGWWVWSKDFKKSPEYNRAWNFSFFLGMDAGIVPKKLLIAEPLRFVPHETNNFTVSSGNQSKDGMRSGHAK